MKKIIALSLAVVLLLSFVACKKSAPKTDEEKYTTEVVTEGDGTYTNYYDKDKVLHKSVFKSSDKKENNNICEYTYNDDGTYTETSTYFSDDENKNILNKSVTVYDKEDRAIKQEQYDLVNGKLVLTSTTVTTYKEDGSSVETTQGKDLVGYKGNIKTVYNYDKSLNTLSYKIYSGDILREEDAKNIRTYYDAKGVLICKIAYKDLDETTAFYASFTVTDKNGKVIQKNGSYKAPSGEYFETK